MKAPNRNQKETLHNDTNAQENVETQDGKTTVRNAARINCPNPASQ